MSYIAGTVTTGSGATGKYECRLEYIFNSQDYINNTTNITIRLQARANNSAYSTNSTFYGQIDGDAFSLATTVGGNTNWVTLASKTWNKAHNADGSLTYHTGGYFDQDYRSIYTLNHGIAQGDIVFPTIPRASTVTATNADIGSATTITINRASTSFTHKLYYKYNSGDSYTLLASDIETSYGWTVPTSVYALIPNALYKTIYIKCETYSGTTLIGTATETTFSATVNQTTNKPTISATIIDTNSTTAALTGDNTKLVKGYSTAQVTYTITALNSATIASKTINGSTLGTSPYSIANIPSGTNTIIATDSRTLSTTLVKTNTLVDYIPLTLSFTAFRPTPTGSEIKVNFTGNYFNNTFGSQANTLALSWKYRLSGASTWTDGGDFTLNTNYKISGNTFFSGTGSSASDISLSTTLFTYTNVYEIAIYYQDKLVNTSQVKVVPKGQPVAYWEDDLFGVNGDFKATGNIKQNDTIIVNSNGTLNADAYIGATGVKITNPETLVTNNLAISSILGRTYSGTSKDLNNYKKAGQYAFYGTNTNSPTTDISTLEVIVYSNDWLLQRITSIVSGSMWERRFTSATTWSSWVQRW